MAPDASAARSASGAPGAAAAPAAFGAPAALGASAAPGASRSSGSLGRVVIGMSGGVDSSVAAWLLKEQGWEVVGLFMKNWEDDDDSRYCSTRQDWIDAASAADVIGIDIEAVNFSAQYKDRVFAEFLREYSAGRTPNPDVLCNAEIKFRAFLDHAVAMGAAHIATGHYARVRAIGAEHVATGHYYARVRAIGAEHVTTGHYPGVGAIGAEHVATGHYPRVGAIGADGRAAEAAAEAGRSAFGTKQAGASADRPASVTNPTGGRADRPASATNPPDASAGRPASATSQVGASRLRYELLRGLDPGKDQSYFLHRLTQAQLSRAMFPIGHLHKREVRAIAARIGLPNAAKKDSTGICFIGERPFREFLNRYLPTRPGPIVNEQGRQIGEHIGLSFYTLGQRKGIGIGGLRESSGEPWFVARKEIERNRLVVVQGHDHPLLMSHSLEADGVHWISGSPPVDESGLGAKTRYRQADAPCALEPLTRERFRLHFPAPQWAVTPGQSAVLYRGEVCLGGGVIASAS